MRKLSVMLLTMISIFVGWCTLASASSDEIRDHFFEVLKDLEGYKATMYSDVGGTPTIGYGHSCESEEEQKRYEGKSITKEEAEVLLHEDVEKIEASIRGNPLVRNIVNLNKRQYYALIMFTFNLGEANLITLVNKTKSSDFKFLKRLNEDFNEGIKNTPIFMMLYCKVNGEVHRGIVRRRLIEILFYYSGETTQAYELFRRIKSDHRLGQSPKMTDKLFLYEEWLEIISKNRKSNQIS